MFIFLGFTKPRGDSMSISKVVGERIRMIRKEKGINQEELAYLSGLSDTYIGQVERGEKNITVDSLSKIAASLEISLEELFRFSESLSHLTNKEVLIQIVDKLYSRSIDEQEEILKIVDTVLALIDKK